MTRMERYNGTGGQRRISSIFRHESRAFFTDARYNVYHDDGFSSKNVLFFMSFCFFFNGSMRQFIAMGLPQIKYIVPVDIYIYIYIAARVL